MRIRAAEADDIPAMVGLINRAYRGDSARGGWTHEADILAGQRIDAAMLAAMLEDKSRTLLIAEEGDALLGCVEVVEQGEAAYVGLLTVDPAQQGRGLGRQLAGGAEDLARNGGCRRTKMTVIEGRDELIAWYERLGYARTGAREPFPMHDQRFGEPLRDKLQFVVLEKALQSG
jgi:ribosomal protein S18 acetylase RimI-like enzyme